MENHYTDEEFEDALSLCDFAVDDQETEQNDIEHLNFTSSQEDLFEFSTSSASSSSDQPNSTADHNNIIFCGKILSCKTENGDEKIPSSSRMLNKNKISTNKSSSKPPQARSMSSIKKHNVIIGLTKIPSTMELSDLRERQNRKLQTLTPKFPAVVDGEAVAVSGKGSSRKSHNWSLLRPFKLKAQYIAAMLTRSSSFGGLRLARPCFD